MAVVGDFALFHCLLCLFVGLFVCLFVMLCLFGVGSMSSWWFRLYLPRIANTAILQYRYRNIAIAIPQSRSSISIL